jgi:hypothetical protein
VPPSKAPIVAAAQDGLHGEARREGVVYLIAADIMCAPGCGLRRGCRRGRSAGQAAASRASSTRVRPSSTTHPRACVAHFFG